MPLLSNNFGSSAYIEGVYPLATGGSPTASPISLCAIAKRVSESIIKSTSFPWSLKYSAIVVATKGHFILNIAGWSLVAIISTERFIPSSPKSLSINSTTSLPRSPTKAMTLISAFTFFAIIPSSVLFPTPLPANIPILCPFPIVNVPSIAFTPNSIFSVIGGLSNGFM